MSESATQTRFFDELLPNYPRLAEFWNRPKREFLEAKARREMGKLSTGEKVALKALASIWWGGARGTFFAVDFSEFGSLSVGYRKPLVEWLIAPFWP